MTYFLHTAVVNIRPKYFRLRVSFLYPYDLIQSSRKYFYTNISCTHKDATESDTGFLHSMSNCFCFYLSSELHVVIFPRTILCMLEEIRISYAEILILFVRIHMNICGEEIIIALVFA